MTENFKIHLSSLLQSFLKVTLKGGILFLFLFSHLNSFSQSDSLTYGKIPIDAKRWYQLNNVSNGLEELFDSNLYKNPNVGWSLVLSNWDAWYPVLNGEQINIDKIRLYDWEGVFTDKPLIIYAVDDKWQRVEIARFTGQAYNTWVGPNPDNPNELSLNTPVNNVRYLVINSWGNYPSELEFYGSYKVPYAITPPIKPSIPLSNYFGVNGFEWNFLNSSGSDIDENMMRAAQNFTGFRNYIDWNRVEDIQGGYTFNPEHEGNWNLDTLFQRCNSDSIQVLACLKNMPQWMVNTYPSNLQNSENVPLIYGSDYSNPNSYIDQAKLAFQFAARFGSNQLIDPSLLSVNTQTRWNADPPNTIKTGLNLVKYIECNNETDKWWKGRSAYQTGREYAANLSAFYDGNLNTMGKAVGVKNADPSMKVVIGGTASSSTDYVRGMVDWCKEFRGYNSNGSVNLCWDVINYHFYANDSKSSQNGNASRGVAPELSGADSVAINFINMSHQYCYDMPVWVTESGYDTKSNGSTQYAIPIGNKSVYGTQADWNLRTSLLYARCGIDRLFFYEMYDDNASGYQFGTCGLLNYDKTPRPSANFLSQVNHKFGNYKYMETLNNNPMVDRYEYNGQSMYAIWVPDEKGRTADYNLYTANVDSLNIYTPQSGADSLSVSVQPYINGFVTVTATETPVFVFPGKKTAQIQLVNFSGNAVNNSNTTLLNWTISSDKSISYFSLERMDETSGVFAEIAKISSNANSDNSPTYSYTDNSATNGIKHYRLKPVLNDDSNFYSPIITIAAINTASLIVYPNPVFNYLNIKGLLPKVMTHLQLISSTGSVVRTNIAFASTFTWNLRSLAAGTYYLVADDGISVRKTVVYKASKK
jgi:endoglucanase